MRASVTFFLRDCKAKGQTAVLCRLRFNNKSVNIPTRISIEPKNWSKAKKRPMVNKGPVYSELKHQLDVKESRILQVLFTYFTENNRWPEPREIKQAVILSLYGEQSSIKGVPTSFIEFWEYYVDQLQVKRTGTDSTRITAATVQSYNNVLHKLERFADYNRLALSFTSIDLPFYYDFVKYLEEQEGLALNTIGKVISKVKAVLKDAHSLGLHNNTVYLNRNFRVVKERSSAIYLKPNDLSALAELDLSGDKELDNVRNLFMILCYSGQRYGDLEAVLNPENREQINGQEFIRILQNKTHKKIAIPVSEELKTYLSKEPIHRSEPHINRKIKTIGSMVPSFHRIESSQRTIGGQATKLDAPFYSMLKTHAGRRTYATINYIHNNKSISSVMAVTGHAKESTFLNYVRANDIDRVKNYS